jgi:transcriptional regulator with XRE-family HTH domain
VSRPAGSGQVPLSRRELRELPYSPEAIGLALHSRRVAEGYSRAALARRVRVTEGTIHNWERGRMPVAAARLLSYVYAEGGHDELWRIRALAAEDALRQVTEAIVRYRSGVRGEAQERANGARK